MPDSNKKFFSAAVLLIIAFAFLCCFSTAPAQEKKTEGEQEVTSLKDAKKLLVSKLLDGEIGKRAIYARAMLLKRGVKIATWLDPEKMTVEDESWFFFIDDNPKAEWFHAARLVLIKRKTGKIIVKKVMTPPKKIREMQPMNPFAEEEMEKIKGGARGLGVAPPKMFVKLPLSNAYAVLISGGYDEEGAYERYWNHLSFTYKALKQKYNYVDGQIIVLYANGSHLPSEDLDGDGKDDIDFAATKENLTYVLDQMKTSLTADGKFFFFSTNHGGPEQDKTEWDAVLCLWGELITDDEFAALANKIKCREAIYVFTQCFSGGMIDDIMKVRKPCENPTVLATAACTHQQIGWACDTEGDYSEYPYYWMSAIFGKTPNNDPVNADRNGDGVVSVLEAHHYAKRMISMPQDPVSGFCNPDHDLTLVLPDND